jgi:type IV pilus assembly protein PilE
MPSQFRVLRRIGGFTLIELMIVVAIVAILARVALPIYTDYILRGRLVDATNKMSAMRAQMEQYYQDKRTYIGGPCEAGDTTKDSSGGTIFTISCPTSGGSVSTTSTYLMSATGAGIASGFTYTLNEIGTMATTSTKWATTSTTCWLMKKSDSC